jgi:hypothetical protein
MLRRVLDYRILIPLAIFLGLAPLHPEPHLVGKLRLLASGELKRPVDIFDLMWHAWPLTLLGFRIGRDLGRALGNRRGAS